jgi:hypothetical protein
MHPNADLSEGESISEAIQEPGAPETEIQLLVREEKAEMHEGIPRNAFRIYRLRGGGGRTGSMLHGKNGLIPLACLRGGP